MTEQRELVQCTHCRKRFFVDGFKVNRLGRRLRTCLECNERGRGRVRAMCPHGHRRHDCRGCGGSQICSHDRRRSQCRDCGGSQMCIHGRQRPRCRDCGGVSFCPHGRLRFSCRDCGGSQMCPCGRKRFQCWSCNPVGALWNRACTRIFSAIGTKARAGRSIEYILGCGKEAFFNHIVVLFTIPGNEVCAGIASAKSTSTTASPSDTQVPRVVRPRSMKRSPDSTTAIASRCGRMTTGSRVTVEPTQPHSFQPIHSKSPMTSSPSFSHHTLNRCPSFFYAAHYYARRPSVSWGPSLVSRRPDTGVSPACAPNRIPANMMNE